MIKCQMGMLLESLLTINGVFVALILFVLPLVLNDVHIVHLSKLKCG